MKNIPKTQTLYYKDLDNEINNIDDNSFNLEIKGFLFGTNTNSKEPPQTDKVLYRTKYRFNPKVFDNDYESDSNILLPFPYIYAQYKKGNFLRSKTIKKNKKKPLKISDIMKGITQYDEEEENESENEKANELDNLKDGIHQKRKNNLSPENAEIFFEERLPQDDEEIGQPPQKNNEYSDVEIGEDEEFNELEIPNYNKKNKIFISSNCIGDNNYQFTEHILNKVKSPIDMINIGEKIYELCSINYNSDEKMDLTLLNTFKKNNSINVEIFKNVKMTAQTSQFLQNDKFSLNHFISNEQGDEVPTEIILDNKNYKTDCSIWFGTNKGNLIRIPICNKPSPECQGIVINSEEVGVSSMDIFENFIIMGHFNGTIQIWKNINIIDKSKDVKTEILQVKFIKVNLKKSKFEFIYSDLDGNVNYVKKTKTYFGSKNLTESIYSSKEFPIYKICICSKEKDLKISKKKNIIIALVSLNNISLYKRNQKKEFELLNLIESPNNLKNFSFDCDFGYGFLPLNELKDLSNRKKSEDSSIEKEKNEKLLFVVSYGIVIRAFEINFQKNFSVNINEICHYISEYPILKINFINKSFLTIVDDHDYLKLINTFCFENEIFKEPHSPTKNEIFCYEKIKIKDILKQNKGIINNIPDENIIKKMNYLSSILVFENNIFIMKKQCFLLYKLYKWEEVLANLMQNERYKEMIWILSVILDKNKNVLSIESIDEEFENALQECLYIFLIKGTTKDNNYNEIKMFIEYCLITGRYNDFYKGKNILAQRKLDSYFYEYSSEYILNGDFSDHVFEIEFIKSLINYYLNKNEPVFLSKILLKLNIDNLNNSEIINILDENTIINPFIYAKMKEKEKSNIDYFSLIEYLYNKYLKKAEKEKENNYENKEKIEYIKLMSEHDMKYFYDKPLSCSDYLGHKLLWYIDKCLRNEEYPKNNCLPPKEFEETCKKIFLFLTLDNVMEVLIKFDSFSYFQLLTKLFTEYRLYKLMEIDIGKKKYPYIGLESFVKSYLKDISIESLSEKYFYYQIKLFVEEKTENMKNSIYIKHDFYEMTSLICKKRKNEGISIDRGTMLEAIQFFINYEYIINKSKPDDFYDPFNCHKIPKKTEALYSKYSDDINNSILNLIKRLIDEENFYDSDLENLFSLEGLINLKDIKIYLCEYGKKYDVLFKIKLEEYNNKNPILAKEENIKKLFNWIDSTLNLTKKINSKIIDKEEKKRNYYKNFKSFLTTQFNELVKISPIDLYNLLDKWFYKDLKEICFSINSDELKYIFLDKYLFFQSQQNEKDKDIYYEQYLYMKLELLVKNNHKEQIIKILERNPVLWSNKYLDFLIKNQVLDSAIFISQKLNNTETCINLTVSQIEETFTFINNSLLNYSEKVNYDLILIKLEEIRKYLELSLEACGSWTEINKNYNTEKSKNLWTKFLDLFYDFKNKLEEENKNNQLGIKFRSYNFDILYKKVENNLKDNIELVLSKMNDYIPLSCVADILYEKFKNYKFKEYTKIFQEIFNSNKSNEELFKTLLDLHLNSLKNGQISLLSEIKRGAFSDLEECDYCNNPIIEIEEIKNLIFFKCGHIYHISCCPVEKRQYACYICRTKELEKSVYTDIPNLIFKQKNKGIKNEIIENKMKKEKKKVDKKVKLIEKLKRINNSRYNKFESFKVNIEKISN